MELTRDVDEVGEWYVQFRIVDADGHFQIRERSLGFRWFFVFLLLTTYRGRRKNSPSEVMFLLDEPASNLHATAQQQLLGSLERLSDSSRIIYSTHSHHLINPIWLENTYVVRNLGMDSKADVTDYHARKTDIVIDRYRAFASENPNQSHYFQPVLDILDYMPSRLELVPDMVMVEGKNDFYALRYLHDVVLDLGLDLHFLPGGGAGSLDDNIQLYIGWARNFIVLLDDDQEGKKQKLRYVRQFGAMVESRIFTLGDFHKDFVGKSIEHGFTVDDRKATQDLVYPGDPYRKTKFFRALQENLATQTAVSLGSTATSRFSDLLGRLSTAFDDLRTPPSA